MNSFCIESLWRKMVAVFWLALLTATSVHATVTAGPGTWSSQQTWAADTVNGGNLTGYFYWPASQPTTPNGKRALVLVLHGCQQTASGDVIANSNGGVQLENHRRQIWRSDPRAQCHWQCLQQPLLGLCEHLTDPHQGACRRIARSREPVCHERSVCGRSQSGLCRGALVRWRNDDGAGLYRARRFRWHRH